jgi:hypothetical protein
VCVVYCQQRASTTLHPSSYPPLLLHVRVKDLRRECHVRNTFYSLYPPSNRILVLNSLKGTIPSSLGSMSNLVTL